MEKKMMDIQALLELLERRDLHALRAALLEENEVDIAEFLEELPQDKIVVVFRALPKEMAAEVFSNLEPDTQQVIIQSATWRSCTWTTRWTCWRSCPPTWSSGC